MVYVKTGGEVGGREGWTPSWLIKAFMRIFAVIALFFQTLINPQLSQNGSSSNRGSSSGRATDAVPRRRMGGVGKTMGCDAPMPGGG